MPTAMGNASNVNQAGPVNAGSADTARASSFPSNDAIDEVSTGGGTQNSGQTEGTPAASADPISAPGLDMGGKKFLLDEHATLIAARGSILTLTTGSEVPGIFVEGKSQVIEIAQDSELTLAQGSTLTISGAPSFSPRTKGWKIWLAGIAVIVDIVFIVLAVVSPDTGPLAILIFGAIAFACLMLKEFCGAVAKDATISNALARNLTTVSIVASLFAAVFGSAAAVVTVVKAASAPASVAQLFNPAPSESPTATPSPTP